jgi:lipoate-protein ligase A
MLGILNDRKDIYFNLALEEYFLRKKTEDIFILWQSETAVVVGKHQNTLAEINSVYVREHKIPIARRLSGGGAVVHGPGNLNFTFIMNGEPGRMVNFKRFVTPVVMFLQTLDLEAEIGGRNDLLIRGKKISGNAEHVFRHRMLHHGTLLFNADLTILKESLKIKPGQYSGNAVKSVHSEVANITFFLRNTYSFDKFREHLFQYLQDFFGAKYTRQLTRSECNEIEQLRSTKYATDDWIFRYSPAFEVSGVINLYGQQVHLWFKIVKGIVSDVNIRSDSSIIDREEVVKQFMDVPFDYLQIKKRLMHMGIFTSAQIASFLDILF